MSRSKLRTSGDVVSLIYMAVCRASKEFNSVSRLSFMSAIANSFTDKYDVKLLVYKSSSSLIAFKSSFVK